MRVILIQKFVQKISNKQEYLPIMKSWKVMAVVTHVCTKLKLWNYAYPVERFLQKRKHSKRRLNQRNAYLFKVFFIIMFIPIYFQKYNLFSLPHVLTEPTIGWSLITEVEEKRFYNSVFMVSWHGYRDHRGFLKPSIWKY